MSSTFDLPCVDDARERVDKALSTRRFFVDFVKDVGFDANWDIDDIYQKKDVNIIQNGQVFFQTTGKPQTKPNHVNHTILFHIYSKLNSGQNIITVLAYREKTDGVKTYVLNMKNIKNVVVIDDLLTKFTEYHDGSKTSSDNEVNTHYTYQKIHSKKYVVEVYSKNNYNISYNENDECISEININLEKCRVSVMYGTIEVEINVDEYWKLKCDRAFGNILNFFIRTVKKHNPNMIANLNKYLSGMHIYESRFERNYHRFSPSLTGLSINELYGNCHESSELPKLSGLSIDELYVNYFDRRSGTPVRVVPPNVAPKFPIFFRSDNEREVHPVSRNRLNMTVYSHVYRRELIMRIEAHEQRIKELKFELEIIEQIEKNIEVKVKEDDELKIVKRMKELFEEERNALKIVIKEQVNDQTLQCSNTHRTLEHLNYSYF